MGKGESCLRIGDGIDGGLDDLFDLILGQPDVLLGHVRHPLADGLLHGGGKAGFKLGLWRGSWPTPRARSPQPRRGTALWHCPLDPLGRPPSNLPTRWHEGGFLTV